MKKEKIPVIALGQVHSVDVGQISPIQVIPIEFTKNGVLCEYLNSWPGRTEELPLELFGIDSGDYYLNEDELIQDD